MINRSYLSILFCCLFMNLPIQALEMAAIFKDRMVLQHSTANPVWGSARPDQIITITCNGVTQSVKTLPDGSWRASLPSLPVGGPYSIEVSADGEHIFLKDILAGEVWLVSGQSNMEWPLEAGVTTPQSEILSSRFPDIRFFRVPYSVSEKTENHFGNDSSRGRWVKCDTDSVLALSAVAYFFAKNLHLDRNVPVGIIMSVWGGTKVEAWSSREALQVNELEYKADSLLQTGGNWAVCNDKQYVQYETLMRTSYKGIETGVTKPEYDDSAWIRCDSPITMTDAGIPGFWGTLWLRKEFQLPELSDSRNLRLELGTVDYMDDVYINGLRIGGETGRNVRRYDIPADLLRKGSNTLAVRLFSRWGTGQLGDTLLTPRIVNPQSGTVCNLSEGWKCSNQIETPLHPLTEYQNYPTALFNAMIAPLIPFTIKGILWYQGEHNIGARNYHHLFTALINDWRAKWGAPRLPFIFAQLANYKYYPDAHRNLPILRESQSIVSQLTDVGMAVTVDISDTIDVHPRNKIDVGKRMFLQASKIAYGKDVVASGPVFQRMEVSGDTLIVTFQNEAAGLTTLSERPLIGFQIAGEEDAYFDADASVSGNKVYLHTSRVKNPKAIRYGWSATTPCNLFNSEGLPASPFRFKIQ